MRESKSALALIALLAVAISMPVFARGNGKGHGGRGAHAPSGGHARSHARSVPNRYFAGRPRVGLFLGAPVFAAPYFYPPYFPPAEYLTPPVEYIEKPPDGTSYFCPEANRFFPNVRQCRGGWEQVMQQSMDASAPAPRGPSAGEWAPAPAAY